MRARLVIPFVGAIALARAAPAVSRSRFAPAGGLSALTDALLAGAPLDARVRRARGVERIPNAFNDPVGDGDGDQGPDATTVRVDRLTSADAHLSVADRISGGADDNRLRERVSGGAGTDRARLDHVDVPRLLERCL